MARKNLAMDSPTNGRLPWQGAAFVGLFVLLTLWQGGYYAASACVLGLLALACVAASLIASVRAKGKIGSHECVIPLLFVGVGVCGLVGSAVQGLTLTGFAESAPWCAVAAFAFLFAQVPGEGRARVMRAAVWFGVASALVGLLFLSGLGALEGTVNAERLQFPFQYANAAGVWYAVSAVLALGSESARLRKGALFLLAALLFTQSAGACLLFAGAFVVLCVHWWRMGAYHRVTQAALLMACAAGVFALCYVLGMSWSFVGAAVAFAGSSFAMQKLGRAKNARKSAVTVCAVLAIGVLACVGVVVQTGRFAQAGRTFVERLVQMKDAFGLVVAHPVFGIGPDGWRFAYPYVQSAQYTATSVHCSYLQIALDTGVVGLLLFVAAVVIGVKRAVVHRDIPVVCALLIVVLHGAIDLDFQFSALLVLLALLLMGRQESTSAVSSRWLKSASVVSFVLIFVVSLSGLWAATVRDECASAAKAGDAGVVRHHLEANPLATHDEAVRTQYAEALWRASEWEELAESFSVDSISSADQALYAAEAQYALGNNADAENIVLSELEREPGNVDLFKSARLLLVAHDASEEAQRRYRAAAAHANELASTGLAALIGNQEHLPETIR